MTAVKQNDNLWLCSPEIQLSFISPREITTKQIGTQIEPLVIK